MYRRFARLLPTTVLFSALLCALLCALLVPTAALAQRDIELNFLGRYETGIVDDGGAEIAAYDSTTSRLFVTNSAENRLLVLDITQPWAPEALPAIDLEPYGGGPNSVATHGGLVAVAVEADNAQAAGSVVFFDVDGQLLGSVEVGALPDMLTFVPDGSKLVVANEGEPLDYCTPGLAEDPEGSISIIDLSRGLALATVATADFHAFDGGVAEGVRIFGPNATVSQDLEPEYVAVSADGGTAWVALQENNALAVVDVEAATVSAVLPLGVKDHSTFRNGLDASDRDDAIRIRPWPVYGMYQPDSIASYQAGGTTYLVTANEGDARDYDCYSEEERVKDLLLDPTAYPDAERLQADSELGRLKTTSATGDADDDGRVEKIHAYGARSFSIWNGSTGELVYDSGNELALATAAVLPKDFNANEGPESFDARSDDKGAEPEGLALGQFRGRTYAFVGLERTGGIAVYDVTEPTAPFFVAYTSSVDFAGDLDAGTAGDVSPEGLLFVPADQSPVPRALLVATHEVSGTVAIFSVRTRQ